MIPDEFLSGLQKYRNKQYWESHEDWEQIWLIAKEPEKSLLRALIQLDAAIIHTRQQHWQGVHNLLTRVLKYLSNCPQTIWNIDIIKLKEQIQLYYQHINKLLNKELQSFNWDLLPSI